jgi:single-strand selective monofunctional uracil DNA glycosylase
MFRIDAHELHRDLGVEQAIVRAKHRAHRASADALAQLIAFADQIASAKPGGLRGGIEEVAVGLLLGSGQRQIVRSAAHYGHNGAARKALGMVSPCARMPDTSLQSISRKLAKVLDEQRFSPPTAFVYNPLVYARAPHEAYLERYGNGRGRVLLMGMNPGPFGMAQTGVPFGDVSMVRDYLGITAKVQAPKNVHPQRPVSGFDCKRSEVSGTRLWGWARDRFPNPRDFFERFFVVNYCPLAFVEASGKNRTPDKLPAAEREPLLATCDAALRDIVKLLEPSLVVGVGAFAETSARRALADTGVKVGCILHPSPASPKANAGWARLAEAELEALGVKL